MQGRIYFSGEYPSATTCLLCFRDSLKLKEVIAIQQEYETAVNAFTLAAEEAAVVAKEQAASHASGGPDANIYTAASGGEEGAVVTLPLGAVLRTALAPYRHILSEEGIVAGSQALRRCFRCKCTKWGHDSARAGSEGNTAYVTACEGVGEEHRLSMEGCKSLVLDVLLKVHPQSHLHEAVEAMRL
jgi:hypothetical protein